MCRVGVNLYSNLNCDGIIGGSDVLLQSTVTDLQGRFFFSTLGDKFAKDDFDPTPAVYTGNDGTLNWDAAWGRSDVVNIVSATDPTYVNASNVALRVSGPNVNASRTFTFSGATSAVLKFSYRRASLNDQGEELIVTINGNPIFNISDGDAVGTDLFYQDITLPLNDTLINTSGANTIIFQTNGNTATDDYFWIDNVELAYLPACFVVEVDPSNTAGRYAAATLNQGSESFDFLGNCGSSIYLGVIATSTATDDNLTVAVDVQQTADVLANDLGEPDTASVSITSVPTNGIATVNSDGTITYSPNPGYDGVDQFEYEVCSLDDPVCVIMAIVNVMSNAQIPGVNTISGVLYGDINPTAFWMSVKGGIGHKCPGLGGQ